MAKKKLSPKRAYHKRWREQQKVLSVERKKPSVSLRELEWENGFNPDGSFDPDRFYWINLREK